ncbi:hypothetical protein H9628_11875 [Weeksellaceae bacterium Sa1CVA4]|uniref:MORN repeat variant n=2 Tax=Kaistella pullorum TaxID=2763074 RepID=A0ABR8WR03_9FLAO|nr:hypothetical protein [Kaistella pullorum]
MKFTILTILFLFFGKSYSQEKIEFEDVFFVNGIAYNKLNNQIFTGIAQNKNKNGHIKFEEIYDNGKLTKTLLYYNNNSKQIISTETIFNQENKRVKVLNFSSDGKKIRETTFDENEKKSEYNSYENGNLILHEEFKNGKKNGKWFCYNDDGTKCEMEYSSGKKIKDCR